MESFILDMFETIDSKNHAGMDKFFHPDIIYERPGFPNIKGYDSFLNFYKYRRIIDTGKHIVEFVVTSDNKAVSVGRFKGVLKNGQPTDERFADVYTFKGEKIIHRATFFFHKVI